MGDPLHGPAGMPDAARAERFRRLRAQFEAAWSQVSREAPEPAIDAYLGDTPEPERSELRTELQKLAQRHRALRVGASPSAIAGRDSEVGRDSGVAFFSLGESAPVASVPPSVTGYEILGELGRGGMGVVYKARQQGLNRVVALKMLLAGGYAGPEEQARFHTEAKAVARLLHPNIVQIYEVGQRDGLPYFSLEFVDGGSLAEKAARKPQTHGDAARLVEILARAMDYAHRSGLIHRDLKPANVLLARGDAGQGVRLGGDDGAGTHETFVPKITDFGLARMLEGDSRQTRSGALMGTPSYMAPEQARGDVRNVGPPADVYALGSILYELLTGRPPFLAATLLDTLEQVRSQEPVPPSRLQPNLPRDLETICLKCLKKEPAARYASAEALGDDLHRFLAGEPILARPVSATERLWRWSRRNPRVAALTGAVLGLLLAVAVISSTLLVRLSKEQGRTRKEREDAVAARGVAERNEATAKEAKRQADENAKVAEEQGQLAVDALYSVVTRVQRQLRNQPGLQKLREVLLDDAFAGLDRVVTGSESSSLANSTRAAAFQHKGDIALELGRTEVALQQYRECQRIVEAMAAVDPSRDTTMWNLGVVFDKLGDVNHRLLGDGAVAREDYGRSISVREALARAPLQSPKLTPEFVKSRLATSHAKQGNLALMLGDPPAAWASYGRYLELQQGRRYGTPAEVLAAARSTEAKAAPIPDPVCLRLGEVSFGLNDAASARGWYDHVLRSSREALERDPNDVDAQRRFSSASAALGDLELQVGEPARALEHYVEAHARTHALAARDPDKVDGQRDEAMAYYRLGTARRQLGETVQADRDFEESRKLREAVAAENPRDAYNQIDLMLVLARCGRHVEAAERAEALRARIPQDPGILFYVACTYALCVPAASAEDADARGRYVDAAVEHIRQAVEHGYRNVVALEFDPDLVPLREEPRFRKLMERLKAGS